LFQVQSVIDGVILGETEANQGFWQTLLAGNKNVFNLGGNVETTTLGAPPLLITIDGIVCNIQEVCLQAPWHFNKSSSMIFSIVLKIAMTACSPIAMTATFA
jgi:hypothetical protein